jgi:hypothetical protein
LTENRAFGADDVAGTLYAGKRPRNLRFLMTDNSNGQVEGQIHRLKLVKRQMYGRAKFNLLRCRVLPYVAAAVTVSPQSAP